MPAVQYKNVSDARSNLKVLLNTASSGASATLRRDANRFALVDAERLRLP